MLLICGKKEVDSNSVTIRRLDSNKQENMEIKKFLETFSALNKTTFRKELNLGAQEQIKE